MRYAIITTLALLAILGWAQSQATAEDTQVQATGQAGSGLHLHTVSLSPKTPEEVTVTDSPCAATLAEVKSRLPMDYGTTWEWAKTDGTWAGLYFPGRNAIALQADQPCQYVGIVAAHEWFHQVQDLSGLHDETMVNGYHRMEIVAECSARQFADTQGWPHYRSYPEMTGVPCSEVQSDVDALMAAV